MTVEVIINSYSVFHTTKKKEQNFFSCPLLKKASTIHSRVCAKKYKRKLKICIKIAITQPATEQNEQKKVHFVYRKKQ